MQMNLSMKNVWRRANSQISMRALITWSYRMQALRGDGNAVYSQKYAEHHKRLKVHAVFCGEYRIFRCHEEVYEVKEALKM